MLRFILNTDRETQPASSSAPLRALCGAFLPFSWVGILLLLSTPAPPRETSAAQRPTNLVFILTDNHGAWTLGCYGNPDIRTPNIDRLAREGTLFSRCYSSNAVCSPTRATYLTGLLPSQ